MSSGKILRERLKAGKVLVGPFLKTLDESFVETAGYSGFDYVILDQEHGPANWETLGRLIRAAKIGGVASIVRIPFVSEETVSKPLDLGADGIQLPNVSGPEDVKNLIKFARFFPKGARGVCRFVRAAKYSALDRKVYFAEANEAFLVVQVEGQKGLENIDEILKVKGYDVLFVGPYDLSQSLGKIGQIDSPEVINTIKDLMRKVKASGKKLGIFSDTIESAVKWRNIGVKYISYSVDVGIFYEKCREINQKIR